MPLAAVVVSGVEKMSFTRMGPEEMEDLRGVAGEPLDSVEVEKVVLRYGGASGAFGAGPDEAGLAFEGVGGGCCCC